MTKEGESPRILQFKESTKVALSRLDEILAKPGMPKIVADYCIAHTTKRRFQKSFDGQGMLERWLSHQGVYWEELEGLFPRIHDVINPANFPKPSAVMGLLKPSEDEKPPVYNVVQFIDLPLHHQPVLLELNPRLRSYTRMSEPWRRIVSIDPNYFSREVMWDYRWRYRIDGGEVQTYSSLRNFYSEMPENEPFFPHLDAVVASNLEDFPVHTTQVFFDYALQQLVNNGVAVMHCIETHPSIFDELRVVVQDRHRYMKQEYLSYYQGDHVLVMSKQTGN